MKMLGSDKHPFRPANLPQHLILEYLKSYETFLQSFVPSSSQEVPSYSRIYHNRWGWLTSATNKVEMNKDPAMHSEILAMQEALTQLNSRYLTDSTLFTILEPCFLCGANILKYRVPRVVYFLTAAPGQGISDYPSELIYKSYHFPELIYIPMDGYQDPFRNFFKKKR